MAPGYFNREGKLYDGTFYHGDIIAAFQRNVPDCYVRDYRARKGELTICRGYREVEGQPGYVYTVPRETICTIPRGNVQATSKFLLADQIRPGWRLQFRNASWKLTEAQMRRIERDLGRGKLFHRGKEAY